MTKLGEKRDRLNENGFLGGERKEMEKSGTFKHMFFGPCGGGQVDGRWPGGDLCAVKVSEVVGEKVWACEEGETRRKRG